MTVSGKRILPVVLGLFITSAIVVSAFPSSQTYAANLTPRKLVLSTSAPSASNATHTFDFTAPTSTTIGSISFTYCTGARVTVCTPPSGLDIHSATVSSTTLSGWAPNVTPAPTNNSIVISGTGTDLSSQAQNISLNGVTNPDGTDCTNQTGSHNCSFYVHIQTFTSADGSGVATDDGWVAGAVSNQIVLQGTMPESLVFCAGDTISNTNGQPDCTTATNATVQFNQLFSPTATATATSMLAASTNASAGYAITYSGPTLTSGGTNTVTPMDDGSGGATTSTTGKSQFGLNLVVNTTPAVGAAVTPADNGTNLLGTAATNYDTADNFKFSTSGDTVATSSAGSDIQAYTVSYMVNVNGAQTAGTYNTTLTYICTATF